MTSQVLLQNTTPQLLFADHGTNFGAAPATAANSLIIGSPTDIQFDFGAIAANGGARQSTKSATLGATRPPAFVLDACMENATAPAAGGTYDFYWATSPSSTAATGNPAALTGADAAFVDTPENLKKMYFIGKLTVEANVINIGKVGIYKPLQEYGMLVVINNTSTASATTADETHITATPLVLQGQDT